MKKFLNSLISSEGCFPLDFNNLTAISLFICIKKKHSKFIKYTEYILIGLYHFFYKQKLYVNRFRGKPDITKFE